MHSRPAAVSASPATGDVIHRGGLVPHYPPYWHYDVPQALLILSRMGLVGDPRASEGIGLLLSRRRYDGTWRAGPAWWRAPGRAGSNVGVVDWRPISSELVTLNALRILAAAGA